MECFIVLTTAVQTKYMPSHIHVSHTSVHTHSYLSHCTGEEPPGQTLKLGFSHGCMAARCQSTEPNDTDTTVVT